MLPRTHRPPGTHDPIPSPSPPCRCAFRGYNTAAERAAAAATPGIRLLSLRGFRELLAFGLAMGVDDGCEPTADEVAAGV